MDAGEFALQINTRDSSARMRCDGSVTRSLSRSTSAVGARFLNRVQVVHHFHQPVSFSTIIIPRSLLIHPQAVIPAGRTVNEDLFRVTLC